MRRLQAAGVTARDLLDGYSALATVIQPGSIAPVVVRDPDDDTVLACALAAEAEIIVSGDGDLIDLQKYQDVRILTAAETLAELSL